MQLPAAPNASRDHLVRTHRSGDGEAKLRLEPDVQLAKNFEYSPPELRQIQPIVGTHREELAAAWKKDVSFDSPV